MQPTLRQVPPSSLSFSTRAVFNPSWPERIAAMYPPGPEPMITTSNFSICVFCHSELSEAATQPRKHSGLRISLQRSAQHDKERKSEIQRQLFRILDALLHFDQECN